MTDQNQNLISPLNATACWTAAVRAREHERSDRLFEDPYALELAGEVGAAWINGRSDASLAPILLRTRYFDDFLMHTVNNEDIRQVVLPAAGLDTRAYRLEWPAGVTLFELDQISILERKGEILERLNARPSCRRITVPADLSAPWGEVLVEASFDPLSPSLWLLEGFLFYLPDADIHQILDQVSTLTAVGSWLGFDIDNPETLTHPLTKTWIEMQASLGAPWVGSLADPVGELEKRGWQAALSQAGAPDANHGRWPYPVIPVEMPGIPHNWFVTGRKEK